MQKPSFHILRVGVAITFLWIGILILKSPEGWGRAIQPWAAGLLPIPLIQAMISTAILDITIGFLLLIDYYVWVVALIASIHLINIPIVSGITGATTRDIAILAATVSLMIDSWPKKIK